MSLAERCDAIVRLIDDALDRMDDSRLPVGPRPAGPRPVGPDVRHRATGYDARRGRRPERRSRTTARPSRT